MIAFAAAATTIGYLFRSTYRPEEMGYFIVLVSIAPMAVMVAVSWVFRLFGRYLR